MSWDEYKICQLCEEAPTTSLHAKYCVPCREIVRAEVGIICKDLYRELEKVPPPKLIPEQKRRAALSLTCQAIAAKATIEDLRDALAMVAVP